MKKTISALLACCMLLGPLALPARAASAPSQQMVEQTIRMMGIITGDEKGDMNLSGLVTRAQFAKMMVAASSHKDTVGSAMGVSPFRDVTYQHWAAGYVKVAVDNGWVNGYMDGTFRPDNSITTEEAAAALLRMLGYTSADLTGSYPAAQLAKYQALGLGDNVTKGQGQYLTRGDCMNIFYNLMEAKTKEGQYYGATLGYPVSEAGVLDYAQLVSDGMEGPYITETGSLNLPFSGDNITVYRNGASASLASAAAYDVYYYNENLRTVWIYHNRATGIYTAASPGTAAPTAVTVGGNQYTVSSSDAAYQLSDMGAFSIGDTVTLLLGVNGEVVGVQSAEVANGEVYGVVTGIETQTYQTSTGKSETRQMVQVACTDGITRQLDSGGVDFKEGALVYANYEDGTAVAKSLSSKRLSGKVSSDGKRIGELEVAEDVQIIDSDEDGAIKVIYPSRLASAELENTDVRFYALDSTGAISHLILNDATGDLGAYGIITSAEEIDEDYGNGNWTLSGTYEYLLNGQQGVVTGSTIYNVKNGPAVFYYDDDGQVRSMKNLPEITITSVSDLSVMAGNQKYLVADEVQVYIKDGSHYDATNLSAVSQGYTLKGYYDQSGSAGGRVRIVIATR